MATRDQILARTAIEMFTEDISWALDRYDKATLQDHVSTVLELQRHEDRECDTLGHLLSSIDECLAISELPTNYTQVNTFYTEQGFDDPYEAATRLQEELEKTRLAIAKLSGAQRSFKRVMKTRKEVSK